MANVKPLRIKIPYPFAEVSPTDTLDAKVYVANGQRLLGRESGSGAHEEISVGFGLTLSSGVLSSSGSLGATISGTITLTVAGWSSNAQTVTVNGVTSTSINIISIQSPVMGSRWGNAKIYATNQGIDSITFECENTPSDPIDFIVIILK